MNKIYNKREIYLDACSTTPPREEVVTRIVNVQKSYWGNASSLHTYGLNAADILERSRLNIANIFSSEPRDIIFTSGATESINLALEGSTRSLKKGRLVISSVEHPAVISAARKLSNNGWNISFWPVDNQGRVRLDLLDEILSPPTNIVSLIWAQSEVGTIQPIELIGSECKKRNILFHTDATQIVSHKELIWNDLPIDLLSLSAHKFQGPKGIGLLLKKLNSSSRFIPLMGGGQQEYGFRSGTEPVALIAGMSLALSLIYNKDQQSSECNDTNKTVKQLTEKLKSDLEQLRGIKFTGDPINRLPNHISMLIGSSDHRPLSGRKIVRALSNKGIYASSGSACVSGKVQDSHVLSAMKIDKPWLQSGLRFSLGPWLNEDDLQDVPSLLESCIDELS